MTITWSVSSSDVSGIKHFEVQYREYITHGCSSGTHIPSTKKSESVYPLVCINDINTLLKIQLVVTYR